METIQEIDFSNVDSVVKDGISLTELVVDGVTVWNSAYLGKLWQQIGSDVNGSGNDQVGYGELAGFSVSVSKSGTRVAVSSPGYVVNEPLVDKETNRFGDNSTGQSVLGSVTVYDWNGTTWVPMEIADSRRVSFRGSDGLPMAFGFSSRAEPDYQNEQRYNPFRLNPSVAYFWNVQASGAGQYRYPRSGTTSGVNQRTTQTHPSLLFGQAMDMSDDGDHLVIASRGSHAAHINPRLQRDREQGYLSYWKAEDIDGTKKWALKGLAYDFNAPDPVFEVNPPYDLNPGVGETVKISRDGSVIAVLNSNGQAWVVKSETGRQSLALESGEVSSSDIYHGLNPDLPLGTWEKGGKGPAHSLSAKTMVKFKLDNYSPVSRRNYTNPYTELFDWINASYDSVKPYVESVVDWEDGDLIPFAALGIRGIGGESVYYFEAYARLSDGTIRKMRFPMNSVSTYTDYSYDFEESYEAPSYHVLPESKVQDIAINGDGRICVISRNVTRGGLSNSGEVSVYRTAFGEYKNEDGSLRSFDYSTKVGLSINAERYSGFEENSLFGERLAMDGSGLTFAGTVYKSGNLHAKVYKLGASGSDTDADAGRLGTDTYTQLGSDIPLFVEEFGDNQQLTSFKMSTDGLTISAQIDGYIWPIPYSYSALLASKSGTIPYYLRLPHDGVNLPYVSPEPHTFATSVFGETVVNIDDPVTITASTAILVYRWSGSSWGLLSREIKYEKSFDGVDSITDEGYTTGIEFPQASNLPGLIRIGPNIDASSNNLPSGNESLAYGSSTDNVDNLAPINTGSILSALYPRSTSDISEDGSIVCLGKPLNDMSGFGSGAHSTFELR